MIFAYLNLFQRIKKSNNVNKYNENEITAEKKHFHTIATKKTQIHYVKIETTVT